jgi:hypothetical protein
MYDRGFWSIGFLLHFIIYQEPGCNANLNYYWQPSLMVPIFTQDLSYKSKEIHRI